MPVWIILQEVNDFVDSLLLVKSTAYKNRTYTSSHVMDGFLALDKSTTDITISSPDRMVLHQHWLCKI